MPPASAAPAPPPGQLCCARLACPSQRLARFWAQPLPTPPPQLELYRDTRDSILLATQNPDCLRDMSAAARDRALQREMRAEGNLHPALQTPDGHYKVRSGGSWLGSLQRMVGHMPPSCIVILCPSLPRLACAVPESRQRGGGGIPAGHARPAAPGSPLCVP